MKAENVGKSSVADPTLISNTPSSSSNLIDFVLVRLLIWRKILLLTDGRDKTLKIFQYLAKVMLWSDILSPKSKSESKAKLLTSHFSLIRKVLRLGHVLEPFHDGLDLIGKKSYNDLAEKLAPLNVVISMLNDMTDDIICLSKLGMLEKPWIDYFTPISDRLWFAGIFLDIHANVADYQKLVMKHQKEEDATSREKGSQKMFVSRLSLGKLMADFLFCSIDVFHIQKTEGIQAISGLISALLGTIKLYLKQFSA